MIMRTEKNKNYTVMGNYHLRDKELSLKAKGLLSIMLSLPDGWNFSTQGLTTLSSDGETAIRSTLKELEQKGYLKRNKVRINGKIVDWEYVVYEQKHPCVPVDESPVDENVHVNNRTQLNTKEINTKKLNTSQQTDSSASDAPIPAESVRNEKPKSLWDISREMTGNDPFTFPYQPTSDSEEKSAAGIVKKKPLVKNLTDTDREISLERAALLGKAYGMAIMNDVPFSMQCGTDHGVATLTMEGAFDCWLDNALYREDAREAYLSKFLEAWENICDNCADRFWMPVRGGEGYVWQNVIRKYAREWNPGTLSERREAKAKEIL